MKKKLLLSSVAALTLFAAYTTVNADTTNGSSVGPVNRLTGKVEPKTYTSGNTVVSAHTGVVADADQYKPAAPATNPYDVRNRIGKDGKVLPDVYANGTHVRIHVKDVQGNPVPGVKVAALIYSSKDAFEKGEKPVNVPKGTEVGTTDAAGDVEFALANGGYVLFRVDEAPKGYFVPNKLVVGTELDAEEVTREGNDMFVTGELEIEKTDTYNVAKEEWVQEEAGWRYYANNKAVTGWKQVDGKWFFFNAEGVSQKWWVQDNGTWYYLNGSGEMQTGWLQDNGTWYYLEASGAMKASQWFEVDGKWYYVDATGALAVNTTVDGYTVNANGEWV